MIINKEKEEKTIGFFGDSFCANSTSEHSWCRRLADKLGCGAITHWGVGGTSVWYMLLKFNKLLQSNELPKYIVILYTEQDRIYHPDVLLPAGSAAEKSETELEMAADMYRKHLDFKDKNELQYRSSVQWFDQNILKKLETDHKIIQAFSFEKPLWELSSGKVVNEPFYPTYLQNKNKGILDSNLINHMTADQNEEIAESFSKLFKTL